MPGGWVLDSSLGEAPTNQDSVSGLLPYSPGAFLVCTLCYRKLLGEAPWQGTEDRCPSAASGRQKGKELVGGSQRPEVDWHMSLLLTFNCLGYSHVVPPTCKGVWEMESCCVPREKKNHIW